MRASVAAAFVLLAVAVRATGAPTEPRAGERSASGRLIVYVLHSVEKHRPIPIELRTTYGYLIINVGTDTKPKPLFRLATRKTGTLQDFDSFAGFSAALAKLPRGAALTDYDKCTVSLSWGLGFDWGKLERTCKRLGLRLNGPDITCNCT